MDTPIRDYQRGAIRVSDAERDQAVAELSAHYQSGRLTLDEFDERTSRALRAQTGSDLSALFADLPGAGVPTAGRPVTPVMPANLDGRRWASRPRIARTVIACAIVAIILGNVTGGHHHSLDLGWLVPVVVLGFVFLRLHRRHH